MAAATQSAIAISYGVLLVLGGAMGYALKRSLPSLVAGGGTGLAILALEALQTARDRSLSFVQAALSGAVAAYMLRNYFRSFEKRPLGIAAVSAVATLVFLARATAPPKRSA